MYIVSLVVNPNDKEAIDIYSHLVLDDLIYLIVEIIKIIKKTAINISFLANLEK